MHRFRFERIPRQRHSLAHIRINHKFERERGVSFRRSFANVLPRALYENELMVNSDWQRHRKKQGRIRSIRCVSQASERMRYGPTDGPTDGRTDPLIEMQGRTDRQTDRQADRQAERQR